MSNEYKTDFIELVADNSSGIQKLHISTDLCNVTSEREYWFTLTGRYNGELIQLGFNELSRLHIEDLRDKLNEFLTPNPKEGE